MSITIGYDFENNKIIKNEEYYYGNKDEEDVLNLIISKLETMFNKNDFKIKSNTPNYLTLKYRDSDIARVKYTDRSKWLSIWVTSIDRDKYKNDPLFQAQSNKNQVQWKSTLNGKNIDNYVNILINACKEVDNWNA